MCGRGRSAMLKILENYAEGVFEPDDVRVLVATFDEAWHQLMKSGASFNSRNPIDQARAVIGRCIIDEATKGKRDQHRLSESALLRYSQSILRKPKSG